VDVYGPIWSMADESAKTGCTNLSLAAHKDYLMLLPSKSYALRAEELRLPSVFKNVCNHLFIVYLKLYFMPDLKTNSETWTFRETTITGIALEKIC
jgi:hypothetical protein